MKILRFVIVINFVLITNQVFGAEVGMPQLNPEFWTAQIFWLIIIFSGLYLIVWRIFLPKISNSIENRKSRVVNDLNETQKLKDLAEKKLSEYNKIIENSEKEAKKIIEDNKKKLLSSIDKKKKDFNEEIEKELFNAENEIKNFKKNSILNINKISVEVSKDLIKQMIGTEINTSNVSAIVEGVSKRKLGEIK